MACRSELRGLGAAATEIEKLGGRLLAVSVDSPAENQRVANQLRLPFAILSDESRKVTKAYGLLHSGGGPGGTDIPIPAHLLIQPDGRVRWKHVSRLVQDRPHPDEVVARIRELSASQ